MNQSLLLCFLCSLIFACVSQRPDSGAINMKFQTVAVDAYGYWEEPGHLLIQDTLAWSESWARLYEGQDPLPPQQYVDFTKQSLLIYRLGTRNTGGYSVSVQNMQVKGDTLVVDVIEEEPGAGCMTTMAITNPFVIVAFDKLKVSRVEIRSTTQNRPCR